MGQFRKIKNKWPWRQPPGWDRLNPENGCGAENQEIKNKEIKNQNHGEFGDQEKSKINAVSYVSDSQSTVSGHFLQIYV